MKRRVALILGAAICLGQPDAGAADVPGSKDPLSFKRYEGAEIVAYFERSYDKYENVVGPDANGQFVTPKTETVQGAVTRVIYRVPSGHTALELLTNYERMFNELGFKKQFDLSDCDWYNNLFRHFDSGLGGAPGSSPFLALTSKGCYATEKGAIDGHDVTAAVLIVEAKAGSYQAPKAHPIAIQQGDILVGLDVVVSTVVQDKMVLVKAEDMARALQRTGQVDVYGILFDIDKTAIKAESAATLEQVAKLMKNDPTLKLEVSGHTDNTGNAEHNMALSEGRAKAVVAALVQKYGIGAARLTAKGYGDTKPVADNATDAGKAQNRRVELKKI